MTHLEITKETRGLDGVSMKKNEKLKDLLNTKYTGIQFKHSNGR